MDIMKNIDSLASKVGLDKVAGAGDVVENLKGKASDLLDKGGDALKNLADKLG